MTVPVREPSSTLTASLNIPPSQNTAPVYEHRCLYTHDLRRKQKRWQDGFLKYHTFNKRVMVYDVPRNYIGDMHAADEVHDGDEVTLERGAVMVQVGERVAIAETDLSGVVHKRKDKNTEQVANAEARPPVGSLQPRSSNMPPRTPSRFIGWSGRAVMPQKSPFELRQTHDSEVGEQEPQRPAKRQRREEDNHIPLWEILKTSRATRPRTSSTSHPAAPTPLRVPAKAPTKPKNKIAAPKAASTGQGRLNVKEIIDITSSMDETANDTGREPPRMRSSRITVEGQASPGTHGISIARKAQEPKNGDTFNGPPRSSPMRQPRFDARTVQPPANEQRSEPSRDQPSLPKETPKSRLSKSRKQPITPCEPSSPSVSTTNHLPPTGPQAQAPTIDLDPEVTQAQIKPQPEKRVLKPLRIASRAPRKTLLCEEEEVEPPLPANIPLSAPIEDNPVPIGLVGSQPLQETHRGSQEPSVAKESRSPPPLDHNTSGNIRGPSKQRLEASIAPHNRTNVNDDKISELLPLPAQSPKQEQAEPNLGDSPKIPARKHQETGPPAANSIATKTAPLRRNATDPYTTSNPLTSRFKQPLRRVETHPAADKVVDSHNLNGRTTAQLNRNAGAVQAVEKQIVGSEVKDGGPWSREAWDLFGWCPESKKAVLGWSYG